MARHRSKNKKQASEGGLSTFLLKFGSKTLIGVVIVVVFLSIVQCSIKKPEAPEWNTNFVVPVVNRTYPMAEIISMADQDGLQMDADSNVVYTIDYEIDPVALDDENLTAPEMTYDMAERLGPIELTPPSVPPVATAIDDIGPLAAGLPGYIPEADFSLTHDMPTISTFQSVTVDTGIMYIVVNNQLGVDLSILTIQVYDQTRGTVIASGAYPGGVNNGDIDSLTMPLDGKTISSSLEIRAFCHNLGDTILSASGKQLVTSVEFSDVFTATTATAVVPAITPIPFSQEATFGRPGDTDVLHMAALSSGMVNLLIENNTGIDAEMAIMIPDLKSASGTPLAINQSISAHSLETVGIDISGYEIRPTDLVSPQVLPINVVVSSPGSGGSVVVVDQNDEFDLVASLSDLSFSTVTGVFAATEASFDPFVEEIDVPKGFDGIDLVCAILNLEIHNDVELPGSLDLILTDGTGRELIIAGDIAPGTPDSAATTIITVYDSTFLSPVPENLILSGSATFGDGVSVGTINNSDSVYARVSLTAPIEAVISETTLDADIQEESIDQEDIDAITDHVVSAAFVYNVTNHLPVGARVQIVLGGDTIALAAEETTVRPDLVLGDDEDISVLAAPTIGGIVPADSVYTTGYRTILLDSLDIQILKNDPLFIGNVITLLDSGGQPVKLTNSDYITINGRIEVEYRFDGEF